MAVEVIVSEMSVSGATNSSTSVGNHSPHRPTAPNDGRSSRRRAYNVDFGVSPTASLPPSTGSLRSVDVDRMERRFNGIASSIGDLVRGNMVRSVNDINNDIIAAIKEMNTLERNNSDIRLVEAYGEKINDLQQEKLQSAQLRNSMFNGFCFENETNVQENTADEVGEGSAISVATDEDLHREVRRRRSIAIRNRRTPD